MHSVEEKLFVWHKIYKALDEARQRLKTTASNGGPVQAATEAEVLKLQRESDSAFAEVQARLAVCKRGAGAAAGRPAELLI
jgi:hypothetical protein